MVEGDCVCSLLYPKSERKTDFLHFFILYEKAAKANIFTMNVVSVSQCHCQLLSASVVAPEPEPMEP